MKKKTSKTSIIEKLIGFAFVNYKAILTIVGIIIFFAFFTKCTPKIKYDTSVLQVCLNPKIPTDSDFSLVTNSRIAIGIAGKVEVHEWQHALPDSRIPDETNEVDIVICVDEGIETIDKCNYTGGTSYYIQKYHPEIFVFNDYSKEWFASTSFLGSSPKFLECPLSFNNSNNFKGELPTKQFVDWVEENIP